ncbi:MAG: hypothetical protein M3N97_06110, partial [Pseudomonadota bacterium]|nr:hypothetical protein [Pseudomonadota bacterium]
KADASGTPIGVRPVLIFTRGKEKKGDIIPYSSAFLILYLDLPCPLPIADGADYHRYADMLGVGCWVPTLGGGFRSIDRYGHQHDQVRLDLMKTAAFHTDEKTFTIADENAEWFERSINASSGTDG